MTHRNILPSDEELIRSCRAGDDSAWEQIVLKYQNLLFSLSRRAGLSSESASDVLQEVFTTLFIRLDSLEQPQYLRAWLVTTAKHKTIRAIQKEARIKRKTVEGDDDDESFFEIADQAPLPDETLVKIETASRIEEALTQIDERCMKLLVMLYLSSREYSYAEISELLGISLGSIGPTRARCLKKLLKFLPE